MVDKNNTESLVRRNLMARKGYSPYCGNHSPNCDNPRTDFNGEQFVCGSCGWVSEFSKDFINKYKRKWRVV